MNIKAITLWQPYASLFALGIKTIETRGWGPRGMKTGQHLAIHSAKTKAHHSQLQAAFAALNSGLDLPIFTDLPFGKVVAIVKLLEVIPISDLIMSRVSSNDKKFGDFGPNRLAWVTELILAFDDPIPARGQQGLWDWQPDDEAAALITAALGSI